MIFCYFWVRGKEKVNHEFQKNVCAFLLFSEKRNQKKITLKVNMCGGIVQHKEKKWGREDEREKAQKRRTTADREKQKTFSRF